MDRMNQENLYHIKRAFERQTGTRLLPLCLKREEEQDEKKATRKKVPTVMLIAAVTAVFIVLSAFAVTFFSTWAGDSLTITASYYGSGIVWLEITNQSDRDLKLEPKINIYYYSTQKLVKKTGAEPYIENLTIPANSTEMVRVDLRRSYDVEALENTKNDFFYLQVTNDDFLTGHKWSCMVSFVVSDYVTPWYTVSDESCREGVLPSLRPYFRNFTPDIFARWPDAFEYLELVQDELAKVDGKLVRACEPPIYFDYYDWLGSTHWSSFDGYNKLLGVDNSEYHDMIGVDLPCVQDDGTYGGGWIMPLFYLYQYRKADITSPKDYVFMSGNLLTFEEIEPYKVYDDGEYVIYEMHHLIYSNLEAYVQDMLLQRDDVYMNDQIWKRIRDFYDYFSVPENMEKGFYNAYDPGIHAKNEIMTMEDVLTLAQKGEEVSFEDIRQYRGSPSGLTFYESGTGGRYEIDGNYELFYALHLDGSLRGWHLVYSPTGEYIDIRHDDIEAFIEAHGAPLPRCDCKKIVESSKENHGWMVTLDWLLKRGNDIAAGELGHACSYRLEEDDGTERHIEIHPIYRNDNFYVMDCWSDELNRWMLWLVHDKSGDRCDLETEDAAAFVAAHGGSS